MAKRKRLTAPNLTSNPAALSAGEAAPETKSIQLPSEIPEGVVPARVLQRRVPIAEVAGQSARDAAFEKVAGELASAQSEGRLITKIALADIDADYLIRDRLVVDEGEMAVLEASIEARGQQTPIEVVDQGNGRYGLISGWRRLRALKALAARGDGPDVALALIRSPDGAPEAYTAMVEENEIRVGLTYYERAAIVRHALQRDVFRTEKEALNTLFAAASRAKRSKIKSFIPVVAALGGALQHPAALTERIGLALSARLLEEPDLGRALFAVLDGAEAAPRSQDEEQALLQGFLELSQPKAAPKPAAAPALPSPQIPAAPGIKVTRRGQSLTLSGDDLSEALMDAVEALVRDWKG